MLNRMFCDAKPIELNASSTPTDFAPETVVLRVVASMSDVFVAESATSPSVVWMWLESTHASALLWTTFVAMVALTASDAPLPFHELPPEEVALASAVAMIVAFSIADTRREAAVTVAFLTWLSTVLRTSLRTTIPPTPVESDVVTLSPCGMSVVTATGCQ